MRDCSHYWIELSKYSAAVLLFLILFERCNYIFEHVHLYIQ